MKKKHLLTLAILLITIFSCSKKEFEVRIRSGILMKSGDVKKVARQEFFILKDSAVLLWKNIQKKYEDIDYTNIGSEAKKKGIILNNEIAILAEEINQSSQQKNIFEELLKERNSLIARCIDMVHNNIKKGELDNLNEALKQQLRLLLYKYEDMIKNSGNAIQKPNLNEDINLYRGINEIIKTSFWQSQIVKARELSGLFDSLSERANSARFNAKELENKIESFKSKLEIMAKNEFQRKINDITVSVIRTNLDGEATLKLKSGIYYIFGLSQISINFILWDYPIKVDDNNTYFEISNDNALSISQEEEGMIKVLKKLFYE
jgi:hypothetical protein